MVDGSAAILSIKNFSIGLHVMYLYLPDTPRIWGAYTHCQAIFPLHRVVFILTLLIKNTDYSGYDMFSVFHKHKCCCTFPEREPPWGRSISQPKCYQELTPIKIITTANKIHVIVLPLHRQAFVSNRSGTAERWNWTTWQYYQYFDLCVYVQTVLVERRLIFKTDTFPLLFLHRINLYTTANSCKSSISHSPCFLGRFSDVSAKLVSLPNFFRRSCKDKVNLYT